MRKAVADRPTRTQISSTHRIPAPIAGWDAQSALADMAADSAVILDNFIPRPGYIEMRKGSITQASGLGANIQTLMTWRGTTDKLIAAAGGGKLYDVTALNTVNPVALYSAATVDQWSWVDFANSAGTWLLAVNGTDTPIKYDGTTVTTTAFTAAGLTPTALSTIMSHKGRLHMGEKGTLHVWYATTPGALAGACGLLDLGPVCSKGGTIACIGTCSLWYSTGLDDFAVYVTTQGQVVVYQGTDPGQATAWSLVGVYDLGIPMGARSLIKFGSDLAVITGTGVIPLSQAIKLDRAQDNSIALTQKIQNAFQTSAATLGAGWGWQGFLYPTGALGIFNIPSNPAVQYVQNLQTGAWCRFTGMNATCWGFANSLAYWAQGTTVYQLDAGADDAGTTITYDLLGAWSDHGFSGEKRYTMLRPLMSTVSWITPALEVNTNYNPTVPTAVAIVFNASVQVATPQFAWGTATGIGWVGAPRMRIMLSAVPQTNVAIDSLDVDELSVGDGLGGAGPALTTADATASVPFQLTGFDCVFERGGVL